FVLFTSTSYSGVFNPRARTAQAGPAWNPPVASLCRLMHRLSPRFVEIGTNESVARTLRIVHGISTNTTASVATPAYPITDRHRVPATTSTTNNTGMNMSEIGRTSADNARTTPKTATRRQRLRSVE